MTIITLTLGLMVTLGSVFSRWQQQAERAAALAITDQRKEPAPAQFHSWRRWLRTTTRELLFLWIVGLMCGGVLFLSLKGGS
jgi:hypothetical protein